MKLLSNAYKGGWKIKTQRQRIIIVDDDMTDLTICRDMLKTFYDVTPVATSAKMFELLEKIPVDLILLDVEMPEMSGYETIQKLKNDSRFNAIPVIFLTATNNKASELEGFDLGAADYILKPFFAPLLLRRIHNLLLLEQQKKDLQDSRAAIKDYADNLEQKVSEKTKEVTDLQNTILNTIADLVEFRDELTGGHIARTQLYLKKLTEELILQGKYADETTDWNMEIFLSSAPLHDVGKIAISDLILNKPGKLNNEEFEIMKTHVTVGIDALEKIMRNSKKHVFLNYALLIAGTHHEKWDGSGYPMGLKGRNIPLEGRLMAIADVYDALTTVRPYKKAFTHDEASTIIEEGAGTHFDPVLVEVFKTIKDDFEQVSIKGAIT